MHEKYKLMCEQELDPEEKRVWATEGNLTACVNIACCYAELGKLELAIKLYETAKALAEEVGNRSSLETVRHNLQTIYSKLGHKYLSTGQHDKAVGQFKCGHARLVCCERKR